MDLHVTIVRVLWRMRRACIQVGPSHQAFFSSFLKWKRECGAPVSASSSSLSSASWALVIYLAVHFLPFSPPPHLVSCSDVSFLLYYCCSFYKNRLGHDAASLQKYASLHYNTLHLHTSSSRKLSTVPRIASQPRYVNWLTSAKDARQLRARTWRY